ncbi:glutamate-rich protein 3 isoform X5 [Equus quagga]|uniref:glutamate-rich protein 3 isoform X5 n=1 Tax=Equus quagga TaxID=89248 RepID=UPI001EE1F74F|nr:glutamate-rich protein 3 isoform X5 [Equus quagga]
MPIETNLEHFISAVLHNLKKSESQQIKLHSGLESERRKCSVKTKYRPTPSSRMCSKREVKTTPGFHQGKIVTLMRTLFSTSSAAPITRSGRILSEKEYKLNIMKRDHQKYIRECLAQAIFHKVLDMERYHQLEIRKKLETLARKERIQRFKGEPTRWSIENNMPILSPHPPVGPKTNRGHSVLVDEGHSSLTALTAPRPYTAPGNMQPPIRLQPLPSNPAIGTVPKMTSGSRSKASLLENEAPFPIGGKKAVMKFRNSMENSQGMNRYQFPNINNYMLPIPPPPPPHSGTITRGNRPETCRRRRFRPITAPNGLEPLFTKDSRRIHNKTPLHSNAAITMIYLGKNVHLSYDDPDFRDEIKVYQQHCGGENLCVYKGKLLEKETFQFISKRHHGFPFSLTFYLNGIQVNRLSSCCEYKHRKGSRLGGKRGYFGFVCVERSSPCYKCIIAMGLDKKPTSPKLRKEKSIEKREELKKGEGKLKKDREYMMPRRNEMEGSKTSASAIFSAQEEKTGFPEVRTAVEEMELRGKPGQDVWEDDQENILKYVGQIIDEAVEPGCHCLDDAESGVSSPDEGEKCSRRPEMDTGAAPNGNLMMVMMEESPAFDSNKESKQAVSEMSTLEKTEAVEEDEVPRGRDADIIEEKGDVALREEAGAAEVPLDRWKPEAEQSAIVGQFTEEREIPQGIASGAEVAVEGDKRLDKEELNPMGKEAVRHSGGLSEDQAPEEQALTQTVLQTEKATPEEEQGLEKVVLASKAAALTFEHIPEAAALKEAVTPEKGESERGAAVSEAGPEKPHMEDSEEEAFTDLEDVGPVEHTASEREDGSEEAILRREEPAKERKAIRELETPLSPSTSEKVQATQMGVSEDSLEELCEEDVEREKAESEAESNREDDRKEMLPGELDAATERRKAERPKTTLGDTESEREEVTRANAFQDEEQKCKGGERETVREGRPEEETQAPQNEMECDAENEALVGTSKLIEDTGPQGEDSLKEGQVTMFEAAPGFEKSLEDITALRKEGGGERLRDGGDREQEGRAELLGGENMAPPEKENRVSSEQDEGPGPEGEGMLGAPESELAGEAQAPEARMTATGEAQEWAAKGQDGLAGWEGRENKEPLQGPEGVGVMTMTQEDVPEGDSMMAGKLSEEVMDEDPEEEVDKKCTLGTGVMRNRATEGDRSLQGGVAVAEEALHQGGGAAEKRELLADSKTAEGKTEAEKAASFLDVAGEETCHQADEFLGNTAAAEKVVAEEIELSREEVPVVEKVPVTWAPEVGVGALGGRSDLEGKAPQPGQDQEDREAETTQRAESEGKEPGAGSCGGRQEWGTAEGFRLELSQEREPELRRESLLDGETLPVKPDCTGIQEKQEQTVQRESNTDISLNSRRA